MTNPTELLLVSSEHYSWCNTIEFTTTNKSREENWKIIVIRDRGAFLRTFRSEWGDLSASDRWHEVLKKWSRSVKKYCNSSEENRKPEFDFRVKVGVNGLR